ncbi:uncharacterized protein LOC116852678 isoform X2 [Odontomachus brunneus]|uniref:uncharacterized protein LOC116852678 isoform X2 n=1 Tax=Odontomachus brunneus TaxID=486640 RepID=UPI0013F1DA97|nr:uncharacterized protein LOC116852678 isoform X2 [Odontomachus brunneus]
MTSTLTKVRNVKKYHLLQQFLKYYTLQRTKRCLQMRSLFYHYQQRCESECEINPAIQTKSLYKEATISKNTERKSRDNPSDNNEFEKEVLRKLQLLLNKMNAVENRMVLLESSCAMRQFNQEVANAIQYADYDLPLQTMLTLRRIEELLKDSSFADKRKNIVEYIVNTLKQLGGVNLSNIIHNVLKKLLCDNITQNFSYLGQRKKSNFSALKLCTILNRVVRFHKPEASDAEIAEITSGWLVHAKWRQQREEYVY